MTKGVITMGSVGTSKESLLSGVNVQKLEKSKYKGVWYGAKTDPITVKDLLDRIIKSNGVGFTIRTKETLASDNLFGDTIKTYSLVDEEGAGRFKLDTDAINYLKALLSKDSYLRNMLP